MPQGTGMHKLHYCSWISMSLWKNMYVYVLWHLCLCVCVCAQALCYMPLERDTQVKDVLRSCANCPRSFPFLYFSGAAGHLQLGELHCFTIAVWARCAYLALFPHMMGSQRGDAWLLMIEPSLANRCYHLCKPLPLPYTHSPHKRGTNV